MNTLPNRVYTGYHRGRVGYTGHKSMADPLEQFRLEASTLVIQAREALVKKREQEQEALREQERLVKLQQYRDRVNEELQGIHQELSRVANELRELGEDHPQYLVLQEKIAQVELLMADPEEMALRLYASEESEALLQAEKVQMNLRLDEWRRALADDIQQSILNADEYFQASDLAIYVSDYRDDLAAIGLFDKMVELLVQRINELDNSGKPKEIRGHARTLDWLVDFAQKQRYPRTMFGGDGSISKLRQTTRKQAHRPFTYPHLKGKVIVFGGHPHMYEGVRERLTGSMVNLVWFDMEQADTQVRDRSDVVKDADLVVLVTPYASHKFQDIARSACKRFGRELIPCNKTGITSMLDVISQNLVTTEEEEPEVSTVENLNGGLEALANKYGRKR